MGVNNKNVFVGAPDQLTTGAVLRAPLGTALPTTAVATLNAAFDDDPGYVDENGVLISPSRQTQPIRDWSRNVIRHVLDSFDGKLSYAHLELNETAMKIFAGDANVTATAANGSHGAQLAMKIKGEESTHYAWVFKIKDGIKKALVVLPDASVTEQGDIALVANGAVKLPVVLSTYPDANGVSIYIYTDDGVLTA